MIKLKNLIFLAVCSGIILAGCENPYHSGIESQVFHPESCRFSESDRKSRDIVSGLYDNYLDYKLGSKAGNQNDMKKIYEDMKKEAAKIEDGEFKSDVEFILRGIEKDIK